MESSKRKSKSPTDKVKVFNIALFPRSASQCDWRNASGVPILRLTNLKVLQLFPQNPPFGSKLCSRRNVYILGDSWWWCRRRHRSRDLSLPVPVLPRFHVWRRQGKFLCCRLAEWHW
ncbi:hypothetical protein AVEN_229528-1 [Araneus ventricosus]|uniref:Uncharacterized protein n=1 Tax=Araneus ventricosus TaxID=182803 RepID=A0A4Y2EKD2_ARAVE|nr:hypothetical protein AVEN_229528-1 [Araneus ventricosus]